MPLSYAPDAPRLVKGNLYRVTHLIPTPNATYTCGPGPFFESYTTPAANTDVIGSAIVKNAAGTSLLYAGTTGKLLQANGTTGWTDRSGAAYSGSSTGTWTFAQFSDKTLAANGVDKIQAATGGAFADLAAAAPTAKIVIVHENAALAFNTSSVPDGWYRSDTGDPTSWTASSANDADSGVLRGGVGGPITAATVYGPAAIAWKKTAMYAGLTATSGAGGASDPKIRWDFVPGGVGVGCVGPHAHIQTERGLFFVSDRDILVFDGGRPRSIASGKVRNYFFKFAVSREQIFLTHNEVERNIFIWYAISGTYPAQALVYNYDTDRWGELSTISTSGGTVYDYARTPVRNVTYNDYTAVGGITTNTGLEANVVWLSPHAATGTLLANFAASKTQVPAGISAATTWIEGDALRDTNWSQIVVVGGNYPAPSISSIGGNIWYAAGMPATGGSNYTGGVNGHGYGNFRVSGRFIDCSLQWTASSNIHEISDLVFYPTSPGGDK